MRSRITNIIFCLTYVFHVCLGFYEWLTSRHSINTNNEEFYHNLFLISTQFSDENQQVIIQQGKSVIHLRIWYSQR